MLLTTMHIISFKLNNMSIKISVSVKLPLNFEALWSVRVRHALGLGNTLHKLNVY